MLLSAQAHEVQRRRYLQHFAAPAAGTAGGALACSRVASLHLAATLTYATVHTRVAPARCRARPLHEVGAVLPRGPRSHWHRRAPVGCHMPGHGPLWSLRRGQAGQSCASLRLCCAAQCSNAARPRDPIKSEWGPCGHFAACFSYWHGPVCVCMPRSSFTPCVVDTGRQVPGRGGYVFSPRRPAFLH